MIKHLLLLTTLLMPLSSSGQSSSIVGTWLLTAADKILPDGTRVPDYGVSPHGIAIFTPDGYCSIQVYRTDRGGFSSGDKFKGTPEEYKAATLGMSVLFGRYTVDPSTNTLTLHIDRSSVPNLDDTTQVRHYEMKGDDISWKVPQRADGSIPITVLRRAPREHP